MKMFLIFATLLGAALSAQAANLEPVSVLKITRSGDMMPPLSPGAKLRYEIQVQVASGGCTDAKTLKASFKDSPSALVLTVTRTQPDGCEAYLPEGATVTLNVEGPATNKGVQLANPLFVINHVTE